MTKTTAHIALAVLLALSTSSIAGNWYVQGEAGISSPTGKAYDAQGYDVYDTDWSSITRTGTGFTGQAGFQLNPSFALGVQVYRFSSHLDDKANNFPEGSDTITASITTLNATFTALSKNNLHMFATVGIGPYTPGGILGDIFTESSYPGFQAGIGINIALNDHFSLIADYCLTGSLASDASQWVAGGTDFYLPRIQGANFGVRYNFV